MAHGPGTSAHDSSIDYVSAVTHRERVYRLDAGCCGRGDRAYTGLAVGPDGTVWGVLNHTLIELDPTSGHFSATRLPSPPAVEGEPPMDLRDVKGLRRSRHRLARRNEARCRVRVGRPRSPSIRSPMVHCGQPSMLALPRGYFALDIAILADGTIGVGMERFGSSPEPEVISLRHGGPSTQVRVPDGFGVVADGGGFLVGDYRPEFVNRGGSVCGRCRRTSSCRSGDKWT